MQIKNIVSVCFGILFIVPLSVMADNMKLEFRLSGGIAFPSILDPDSMRRSYDRYLSDFAREEGRSRTGSLEEIGPGYEFQGEILIRLGEKFALGAGLGYVHVQSRGNSVELASPASVINILLEDKGAVIPIMINGYYFFPLSSRVRVSLMAGIGYYLAGWNRHRSISERNGFEYSEDGTIDLTSQKIGYQTGIGLEWDISRRFSLLIEGFGRYARISGFNSDWSYEEDGYSDSGHGKFYYYEWFDSSSDEWYASSSTSALTPAANIRNVREAVINFSGFSLRAGIKVRL
jgi:hypothetical protein